MRLATVSAPFRRTALAVLDGQRADHVLTRASARQVHGVLLWVALAASNVHTVRLGRDLTFTTAADVSSSIATQRRRPKADIAAGWPSSGERLTLLELLQEESDPTENETPLETAERVASSANDELSLNREKAKKALAAAREANQTLAEKEADENLAATEAAAAKTEYERTEKEIATKSASISSAPQASSSTNSTDVTTFTTIMDEMNDQLAGAAENSMEELHEAEKNVAHKTDILNDYAANYAEMNYTSEDERRVKIEDLQAFKRKKEAEEKEHQKQEVYNKREEAREKRLQEEAAEEKDVKAQRTSQEHVFKHQTRIADVLDEQQRHLENLNYTVTEEEAFVTEKIATAAHDTLVAKAEKEAASKALSALRTKVREIREAREMKQRLEGEQAELGVKHQVYQAQVQNYTLAVAVLDKSKSEIAHKKELAVTLVQEQKDIAATVEVRSKRQKKEVELMMKAQQKQFDDFSVYRGVTNQFLHFTITLSKSVVLQHEGTVKTLQNRKKVAQEKLDELVGLRLQFQASGPE